MRKRPSADRFRPPHRGVVPGSQSGGVRIAGRSSLPVLLAAAVAALLLIWLVARISVANALLEEPLDVMVVVGGYNSSNTCHLAALVHSRGVRVFHIEDADAVDPATGAVRYQPIGAKQEATAEGWLGDARIVGITAGASTPNNKIGETVARICRTAGVDLGAVVA